MPSSPPLLAAYFPCCPGSLSLPTPPSALALPHTRSPLALSLRNSVQRGGVMVASASTVTSTNPYPATRPSLSSTPLPAHHSLTVQAHHLLPCDLTLSPPSLQSPGTFAAQLCTTQGCDGRKDSLPLAAHSYELLVLPPQLTYLCLPPPSAPLPPPAAPWPSPCATLCNAGA